MFKKLALSLVVALSSFGAVPAASAYSYCDTVPGGRICAETSYKSGWDSHDYLVFDLYGYEWGGTVSCRDNPTTYTWRYETLDGYAPKEILDAMAEGYCEGRLYG